MNSNREEKQQQVLDLLCTAWNTFISIPESHPDDTPDFRRAIHQCQSIIAMQQMRQIDPETWPSYSKTH